MRRFYFNMPKILKIGESVPLTDDIFHHWCKVLRANVGEQAIFFDGQGGEYTVNLTEIGKKNALATVETFDPINRDLPYQVHIGLVMSRGERMDYAIQKATELGVTSIQLLTSERCEVRLKPDQITKKLEHWQGVAIAACEQCGLNRVPTILPPISLADWVLSLAACPDTKLVLAVPNQQNLSETTANVCQSFNNSLSLCFQLLIGAEGGLTAAEINLASQQGFLAWQLGERVLRTETAPVVALATLQTLYILHGLKDDRPLC